MNQQIALAPLWMFCAGYFFGLSLAGAAVIRAAALELKKNLSPKIVDLLLVLHLIPIFLGVRFVVGGIVVDCKLIESSSALTIISMTGAIISGVISMIAAKKLQLKII